MAPIRVGRMAPFLLAVAALIAVGSLRNAAQDKVVTYFYSELKIPWEHGYGQSGQRIAVGERPGVDISRTGDDTYAWEIEALSISDSEVVLRLRVKHFTHYIDDDAVRKQLAKAAPQQITYTPGQQMTIPTEDGSSVILSGSVKHQSPSQVETKPAVEFIPAADEMAVAAPVLIRDRKELLSYALSGGVSPFRCNSDDCGFYVYAPKHGLFFFSIQPLPNAIEGTASMSAIIFSEDGHWYTLYSMRPITGGDQPKKVWIVHVPNYLPSQHRLGGAKSEDALAGVGRGDLSGLLATPLRQKQQR